MVAAHEFFSDFAEAGLSPRHQHEVVDVRSQNFRQLSSDSTAGARDQRRALLRPGSHVHLLNDLASPGQIFDEPSNGDSDLGRRVLL